MPVSLYRLTGIFQYSERVHSILIYIIIYQIIKIYHFL